MWRALLVVIILSLATSARADTPTWIDRSLDRFGIFTFETLNDRQDYVAMFELASALIKTPAFFANKPALTDVTGKVVMWSWRLGHRDSTDPIPTEQYRKRAAAMLSVAAIHPTYGDEALVSALDSLYYIRDLGPAYAVMRQLEADYPDTQSTRWSIRRRIDLHARHGEFVIAARIARQFIETARRTELRQAFYVASDAMPIWLGLGNVATAVHMLDFMSQQARTNTVSNAEMYIMDAAILVDDHRLAALAAR